MSYFGFGSGFGGREASLLFGVAEDIEGIDWKAEVGNNGFDLDKDSSYNFEDMEVY